MEDFSRMMMSSDHLVVGGVPAGGMDGITVVRIDDTHIAEEQSDVRTKVREGATAYYEMGYTLEGEEAAEEEEEEDNSVYVIEYSNPEEEGQSYQFTMSVDRSLPPKKPIIKQSVVRESTKAALPVASNLKRPQRPRKVPKRIRPIEEEDVKKEPILSNKCVLELGEDYSDMMKNNDGKTIICSLCPPPGRFFKKASGLAIHLKQMHNMEGKKTFYCMWCKQNVRSQVELDAHTKRHANQDAVFTCYICSTEKESQSEAGEKVFKGNKWGLRKHLEKEHPGIIPPCHFCHRSFKSLVSYLADQFRHVGVTPYHCARCQIYEITERGLRVHIKNHDKPRKRKREQPAENLSEVPETPAVDNSATDDSDF
ncbi:zinc finger protein 652-A-like [Xyrichtys novacula]|uniref:Zinc finger protein 652-A-like n=1 Tax=Xyrichtys novacula TaxID=13765 RepID=A0AAV1H7T1_XYRNO|nr:zinc finger protein 652-A-like [Xyrichtys novacula]